MHNYYDWQSHYGYGQDDPGTGTGTRETSAPPSTVAQLQAALNEAGASPVLVCDGKWGPKTSTATNAFQAAHGLTASTTATSGLPSVDIGTLALLAPYLASAPKLASKISTAGNTTKVAAAKPVATADKATAKAPAPTATAGVLGSVKPLLTPQNLAIGAAAILGLGILGKK